MRECTWRLRWRLWLFVGALAGNAFAGADDAGAVVVAEGARCRVGLTKVSYDTPGADSAEFLELHVEFVGSSSSVELHGSGATLDAGPDGSADAGVLTLGDCGLAELELVDGGSGKCESYRSIPLAATPVPSDGYVELCAEGSLLDLRGACDVTHAGRSALKDGWLQNGPNDGLRFTSTASPVPPVELSYEGRPSCFAPSARSLATETGQSSGAGTAPEDDVNVVCGDAFALLPASAAPLRRPGRCRLPETVDAAITDVVRSDGADAAPPPWTEERAPATSSSGSSQWYGVGAFDAGLIAVPKRPIPPPRPPGCTVAARRPSRLQRTNLVLAALLAASARLLRRRKRRTLRRRAWGRADPSARSGSLPRR